MMRHIAAMALLTLLAARATADFSSSAMLGRVVRITPPGVGDVIWQMWPYAHPTDGRHLIVCGMMKAPHAEIKASYLYSSTDAGASWRRTMLDRSGTWVSDVNCAYGEGRRAYFLDNVSNFNSNGGLHANSDHMHAYISNDIGEKWHRAATRGWVDWPYLANLPRAARAPDELVIFGNIAVDHSGHFNSSSPVALESSDGGRTFSTLITPRKQDYDHLYASGATVLPDGEALFTGDSGWKGNGALPAFAYSSQSNALVLRSVIVSLTHRAFDLHGSLAQDDSGGRFQGRLYSAWILSDLPHGGDASTLYLATSDDGGFHWSSRAILRSAGIWRREACEGESVFSEASVAVNRGGAVGILWVENGRSLLFASSHDGGRTFSPSVVVAEYLGAPEMDVQQGAGNDAYGLRDTIRSVSGKPDDFHVETSPGLDIQMWADGIGLQVPPRLTDDARGVFHAFWSMPVRAGRIALFTRTISPTQTQTYEPTLDDPTKPSSCFLVNQSPLHPAFPAAVPVVTRPPQSHDVTGSVAIVPLRFSYDATTHTIRVEARVVNGGKAALKGTLMLVATNLHSDFGTAIALNGAPAWDGFPTWRVSASVLAPGGRSAPIRLAFRIEGFRAPDSLRYASGDGVAMKFRAFTLGN